MAARYAPGCRCGGFRERAAGVGRARLDGQAQVADAYAAMDERRAIKVLLRP